MATLRKSANWWVGAPVPITPICTTSGETRDWEKEGSSLVALVERASVTVQVAVGSRYDAAGDVYQAMSTRPSAPAASHGITFERCSATRSTWSFFQLAPPSVELAIQM